MPGSCFLTQSQLKSFVQVIFFFILFCVILYKTLQCNQVQSNNCVGSRSVSLALSQSTKLILLEVIVPCLMFMMSWLVLFSGVLLWRVCSPAVKTRLTANPLCLSRRQQTDWSGLAEARTVRRGYSLLAIGQQSSSYTRVISSADGEDTLGCLINMGLIPMLGLIGKILSQPTLDHLQLNVVPITHILWCFHFGLIFRNKNEQRDDLKKL